MAESITRKNIDLDILDYYDGKIKNYVDDKVGTSSLTIDDTLSDTSTNPVQNKVVKQAIDNKADSSHTHVKADITDFPTSLPANGGNADTVDGYHVDNLIHASESIPPEYITEFLRINDDTNSIERWSANNLRVEFANNATNAENADTVDGLHAKDFSQIIDFGGSETDTKTAIGQSGKTTIYRCSKWTDYPSGCPDGQGTVIAINYNGAGTAGVNNMWVKQIFLTAHYGSPLFHIRYVDATNVGKWAEISTTPIKSTGWVTSPTDQYGTIILPNSDTRRYLSITAAGCYAEMFAFNDEYTVHIVNGNYEKVINTPVKYIAFYIEY